MIDSPKVEPPKDDLRDLVADIVDYGRPIHEAVRDEYIDNLLMQFLALIKLQQEALLNRVEQEVIGEDNYTGAPFTQPYKEPSEVKNNPRAEQRQAIHKLRLEL